jgi:hypothetical protein
MGLAKNPVSVSCTDDTFCIASLAEGFATFDGATWRQRPGSETNGALGRVDCASATFCFGAGKTPQVWNGDRWSAGPPAPAGATAFDFANATLSCPAPNWCMVAAPGAVAVIQPV